MITMQQTLIEHLIHARYWAGHKDDRVSAPEELTVQGEDSKNRSARPVMDCDKRQWWGGEDSGGIHRAK